MVDSTVFTATTTPFEKLTHAQLLKIVSALPDAITPAYVYFEDYLLSQINTLKQAFRPADSAIECNIRYAMKAQSNANILKIFAREGIHFDCSSVYEVMRVMRAGIDPGCIELAS